MGGITSWNDITKMQPSDILSVLAYAQLASTAGEFVNTTTYINSSWNTSPLSIVSAPTVAANGTDNLQKVEEAKQWTMSHKTWNSDASVPPQLQNTVIMRAGIDWNNTLRVELGGDGPTKIQVGLIWNAATSGDAQDEVGVIEWDSLALTGEQDLKFTFLRPGRYCIGILAVVSGAATMFALDVIAAP
jgi:hypothetical protein